MEKVFVFLADGFEEIEGLTVVDVLRRADVDLTTVSITGERMIHGAHQINVEADCLFEEVDFSEGSMLVLPGGMPGTLNLKAHEGLRKLMLQYFENGRHLAAICAAPSILSDLGLLEGKRACAYPSFEENLACGVVAEEPVVTDGTITTGRGMGVAIPFALELVKILASKEKAENLAKEIIYS